MSKIGSKTIIFLNKFFPKVVHPFNLENEGKMTYSEWEYKGGEKVISYYSPYYSGNDMFETKTVLDLGCGGGGKTCYYSKFNPKMIIGIDIDSDMINKAKDFAKNIGCENKCIFTLSSALNIPYDDEYFDTVIMNDFFEHVSDPDKAIKEALRVLKKDGKLFINFPPYSHPWGEHLSDGINIPWVHKFFSEQSMIDAYSKLITNKPDYEKRMNIRFSLDEESGLLHNTYINKMTIKRGDSIINSSGARIYLKKKLPLRKSLKIVNDITGALTGMCIYVLGKGEENEIS